ncbi:MAG: hypothetical protein LBO20_02750, partial [Bifidobacteriaceae bacterium]|nr:hypothetical protein [Bifidobacteriaceae bacterium]
MAGSSLFPVFAALSRRVAQVENEINSGRAASSLPRLNAVEGPPLMLSSKRKAARAAAAGLAGASLLALGLATAAVAAPPGKDAPTFVAYASDGSVDFSSWNPTTDAVLAEASFDRNGRTFDVTIQKPTPQSAGDFLVYPPLASNLIDWDPQVGPGPHFYSNFSSRQMSYFAIGFDAAAQRIVGATPTFYEKAVPGGRAAAQVFTVPGTDGLVTVSDITWVDGQRQLRHLYTVTNKSDEALPGVNFEARIDLALDDNDRVGLAKATGTSVFMENNEVAMYLLLTAGDYLAAGAYSAATSSMTLVTDWQFSHGSELVAPGSLDTALAYALEDRTIQPNSSVSLTALERFYAAGELDEPQAKVVFWDDDADTELAVEGSPVLLTGDPLTPISYTSQDAADALPAGYVVDRIEGADDAYFDDLNDTTPTVTVHARHAHVYADGSASRTIVYQGAGDATPEPVVCQYGWTSDTDLAAGSTAYTIESGCPAVATPVLAGFTADTAEVPALLTGRVSARPEDTTVTVTYTATPAHARVVFWDDEAGVALAVSPIQLNGLVGAPLVFSNEDAAAALPAGYTLDRVEGRGTYDDDDETIQTVTVHARHGHVAGDLVTTRTIT